MILGMDASSRTFSKRRQRTGKWKRSLRGVGRQGQGRGWSGVEWTACGSKEQTCKPMMRHYSSMLLQGLSRKPGALFIISFFFFFFFLRHHGGPLFLSTASWFMSSEGNRGHRRRCCRCSRSQPLGCCTELKVQYLRSGPLHYASS